MADQKPQVDTLDYQFAPEELVTPPSCAPWPEGYEPAGVLEENRKAQQEQRDAEETRRKEARQQREQQKREAEQRKTQQARPSPPARPPGT